MIPATGLRGILCGVSLTNVRVEES